ncbi:MAG: hypothetical protein M1839_004376 [Geoglossum umbratile]|nr:MAG: hypothetical protein M1839_004376 [Geoglossum umbratile]
MQLPPVWRGDLQGTGNTILGTDGALCRSRRTAGYLVFLEGKWNPRKEGPPKESSKYTYDWDIQSDRTYMVATNLFEESFLKMVQSTWLCADRFGACPYLTLDLGIDNPVLTRLSSTMQISAASAVWLFQRKKLKDEMGSSDYSDLRHYSVTFAPGGFQVWQAEFDGKIYSVQEIANGSLTSPDGVKNYVDWSNSIHRLGLGPNARSFKRDVEALYGKTREAEQGEVID